MRWPSNNNIRKEERVKKIIEESNKKLEVESEELYKKLKESGKYYICKPANQLSQSIPNIVELITIKKLINNMIIYSIDDSRLFYLKKVHFYLLFISEV